MSYCEDRYGDDKHHIPSTLDKIPNCELAQIMCLPNAFLFAENHEEIIQVVSYVNHEKFWSQKYTHTKTHVYFRARIIMIFSSF